jgi:hypothetical protein
MPTFFDLRGPQRRFYLSVAAGCGAFGGLAALGVAMSAHDADRALAATPALLLLPIGAYHLRVAFGWVAVDGQGLHTSRLLRGRHFRWSDIARLDTRTWSTRPGGMRYLLWRNPIGTVTVVRVHTVTGRRYYLPAPRTTGANPHFERQLRQLRGARPSTGRDFPSAGRRRGR